MAAARLALRAGMDVDLCAGHRFRSVRVAFGVEQNSARMGYRIVRAERILECALEHFVLCVETAGLGAH